MIGKERINLLQNEIISLSFQQVKIEDEKSKRSKEIEKIQRECKHDFKEYSTGYVECRICGFIGA